MAVYNRYRVYTTEVVISVANKYTTTTAPAVFVAYASNVNSAVATTDLGIETAFSNYFYLAGSGGSPSTKTVKYKYNTAAVLGYK